MEFTADVSIVILNYNTAYHLRQCLESVFENLKEIKYEVIVVDNNSPDREIEKLPDEFPEAVFYLRESNDGFAAGCNYGISKSNGRYILLMNPDVTLIDNSVPHLKSFLDKNKDAGIVSGLMTNDKSEIIYFYNDFPSLEWEFYHLIGFGYDQKIKKLNSIAKEHGKNIFEVDWIHGAFMMMRKEDLIKAGGLNENYFMYYEDVELCYKFRNLSGKKNYCIPETVYRHYTQSSISEEKNDNIFIFHLHRGKLIFLRNYNVLKRLPVYLTGLTYVISRLLILPVWKKYSGCRKEKLKQLLKVLRLYLSSSFVSRSKYEYIGKN